MNTSNRFYASDISRLDTIRGSKKTKCSSLSQRLGFCFSFRVLSLAPAAVAVLLLPTAASAAPVLPEPFYAIGLNSEMLRISQSFSAPGTYRLGGMSTTVAGFPIASLTARAVGDAIGGNAVESIMRYSFVVDGPLNDVVVPLLVTGILHASASGSSQGGASARFSVYSAGRMSSPNLINMLVQSSIQPTDFSGTLPFNLLSGQVGGVTLQVDASSFLGGVANAFADPYIFIDPVFLSSHPGYSVIVSAGIGNAAPAVPIPAAAWLFGSGLLGLIGVARRKRV